MSSRALKDAAYPLIAAIGQALSSPHRLELLDLLAQAPRPVDALAAAIHQSVATTSHHLQLLKRAHLVTAQRQGQHVIYTLADPRIAPLLAALHDVAAAQDAALARLEHDFFHARDALEPVSPDALRARMAAHDALLLDVRPAEEFAAGHLPGARNVPLDELEARLHELPADLPIIAYCRGPLCAFSAEAAQLLRARGLTARHARITPAAFTASLDHAP